jgi:SPX domain protein involved in polyphosphate accumulation
LFGATFSKVAKVAKVASIFCFYIIMINKTILIVLFLLVILAIGLTWLKQRNVLNQFLDSKCSEKISSKNKCYNGMKKCTSMTGYTYVEDVSVNAKANDIKSKIERKTLKCVMASDDKYKLIQLSSIFTPSMFKGTYCDVIYSTYYDYSDLTFLKNRMDHLNLPLAKCVRIRRYKFNPDIFFEIKYSGGAKIRALIDNDYNLLEPENIEEEYEETIVSLLEKIKNKTMLPLFENVYKRLSFIYKNNSSLRMTIDTNIHFNHKNIYGKIDSDILEIKLPETMDIMEMKENIREINHLANTNLKFERFSKFDYYYNMVMNSAS